ncbi:MAG: choice-of-anchor V domain-containing protein, partial [Bacteroidota bacterium]|nr:choice-of-anchor V domain-containing protein [Bacteroidota bacterium]
MKKSFSFLFVLVFPVALLIMAYNTGSPGGKTGSPGDSGNTCTECHSGTATAIDAWIVSNIPPEGYTPGAVYNITAIGTHTGVVLFGFELTAEDDQGNKIGTLTVTDPLQTQHTNSNAAITHTAEGNTPIGNMKTWNMGWTAPMTAVGEITFYAAFNAADGNGNTSGDVIYTSTLTVDNTAPATLISITPDSAIQGEILVTTIIGDHTSFSSSSTATLVFSDDPGETVEGTDIEAVSTEEMNATFSIPVDASTGIWDLLVDGVTLEDA